MKLNLYIFILTITSLFSCQNEQKIDGFYSICSDGEYAEIYFKKDSMRIASQNEWILLSEWRKIEITDDTLYFESFGEWRDDWKAQIRFISKNKTELHNLTNNVKINLERFDENLIFENPNEFWEKFKKRQRSKNCE